MRLPRPHIPLDVRYRVVLRQLGLTPAAIDDHVRVARGEYGRFLELMLPRLRQKLGIAIEHLDHDPALENRMKVMRCGKHVGYLPDANDPDFLIYREGGFRGSAHDIKTRVRGERGQFADNVIAKRARRRKKKAGKRKHKWAPGRKLRSRNNLRRRP